MRKNTFLSCFVMMTFLMACSTAESAGEKDSKKPNVILIMVDDMGWSDIGCYGSEVKTPNLDKLAAKGVRFQQFHNTSKCMPSRTCLITGLYAQQTGGANSTGIKMKNCITFGDLMQSAGYQTFMTGKHHGMDNMYDRGFNRYYGMRDGAANHFNPGKQRPGEALPGQKRREKRVWCFDEKVIVPYTPPKDYYSTDYFTNWAIDFIDERDKEKPFFLYIAYTAPHDPLHAWPKDVAKYKGKYKNGYKPIADARFKKQKKMGLIDASFPRSKSTHADWATLSDAKKKDQQERMEVYAAMIDCVDQNIGKLIAKLKANGEWENTLFMFTADNGSSAENVSKGKGEIGGIDRWSSVQKDWANVHNTPFRFFKNFSYQGGICTPFIAHWPGKIKNPNRFDGQLWHFVDVMATLVDLTGAKYPTTFKGKKVLPYEGESFLSVLTEEKQITRKKPVFWQWARGKALRYGKWKLVTQGKKWELYDMTNDKTETKNLADKFPEIVKKYEALHLDWQKSTKASQ